jgi:hypothetical protein
MNLLHRLFTRGYCGRVRSLGALGIAFTTSALAQITTIDFEDLSLGANSFYNGGPTTNTLGWTSGGATFGNSFNSNFGGFWNGFSYSNVNNTTVAGFTNQYATYTGTGFGGSGNYAVSYFGNRAFINLPVGTFAQSVRVTNTTYAALDMLNGSGFSKKFGGVTGNDPDFFRVTFTGFDGLSGEGNTTGSVTFTLADYTFADNTEDYIVDSWEELDLTPLGGAQSLRLSWASSDTGSFGINTPTYVALDNLTVSAIPEPASAVGLLGGLTLAITLLRRRRQEA